MGGVVDDDAHAVLLLCDVGLKEVQQVMGVDAVECLLTALIEQIAGFLYDCLTLLNRPRTCLANEGEEVGKNGSVDDAKDV